MSLVPTAGLVRPRRGIWSSLLRLAHWVAREIRVRRHMRRLATFDDHMLGDLGIARTEIERAVRGDHERGPAGPVP